MVRQPNVEGMWKYKQKNNVDLSVAEESVLHMKYRYFNFLREKSLFWTEIWSKEKSKFHDGDFAPRFWYSKNKTFPTSWNQSLFWHILLAIQQTPYFIKKQGCPDFNLCNRDNSIFIQVFHIFKKQWRLSTFIWVFHIFK